MTTATAVKFLFARKFDVHRAVQLYEQHELIRQRECLYNLDPMSDPLRTELETGKFTILVSLHWGQYAYNQQQQLWLTITILQPGRDVSGAAIALFSANLHSPLTVTHKTTLQGVVYQLDIALQNVETQSKGLIFIYDMSSSKYSNFDYDLSQKILTLLKVSTHYMLPYTIEFEFFFFAFRLEICKNLSLLNSWKEEKKSRKES